MIKAALCWLGLLAMLEATAQPDNWTVDPTQYEHSMTITWKVILPGEEVEAGDVMAAFVGDEVRGVVSSTFNPVLEAYFFLILVHSNESAGEAVSFSFYNASQDAVTPVDQTVAFVAETSQGTFSDPLIFEIPAPNEPPSVANAIADQAKLEGFGSFTLQLSEVFEDPDDDPLTITATTSNSATATVAVNGTTLTVSEVGLGSTIITVTASDGRGGEVSDVFNVLVSEPTNRPPTVSDAIDDQVFEEGFSSWTLALSPVFSDPDGDGLSFSATSSNNEVITVSVNAGVLSVTEVGPGSSEVTVTASDGRGGEVSDLMTVVVNEPASNPPTVNQALSDVALEEGFSSTTIDLSSTFQDLDGDQLTLTPTSGDTDVVTVSVNGTTLTITEAGTGIVEITVSADDGKGGKIADVFTLIVNEPANNPPTVNEGIDDQAFTEGFVSWTISLSDVFEDQDDDVLTLLSSSSDNSVVTAFILNGSLTVEEGGLGTAEITLTASDGKGGEVSDVFVVTVSEPPNNPPVVSNALPDVELVEGFASLETDLSNVFEDADSDQLALSAASNDTDVITVSVSGSTLTITEIGLGTSQVTITANDGRGGVIGDLITVTVSAPINNPPVFDELIGDQTFTLGFGTWSINLLDVVEDEDGDDVTFSASSSDGSVVTNSVLNGTLTVHEVGLGTSDITVTASDGNGGEVSDVFAVLVSEVPNDPPSIENVLSDLEVEEGFSTLVVDLSAVFDDPDDDDMVLTATSGDIQVVEVAVTESNLTITEVGIGEAEVIVTADDGNGGRTSDKFVITVNEAPNQAPFLQEPLEDLKVEEGFNSTTVDLSNAFDDNDGDLLTLSATLDDTGVVSVSLSSQTLTITEVATGNATITVTASDGNGGQVSDDFVVIVDPKPNTAPEVTSPVEDQLVEEGFGTIELDVSNVFDDEDDDLLLLTVASSDLEVVGVSINAGVVTITEVAAGVAEITVTADDGNGAKVSDVFQVVVSKPPNSAPTVSTEVEDQLVEEGFELLTIYISNVFVDADGDELVLSVITSNGQVVTPALDGEVLSLTEVGLGSAEVTLTADDGNGGVVSETFVVSVNEKPNTPPVVNTALEDLLLEAGFELEVVDLADVFVDEDGDSLVITAVSSDTMVVKVTIEDGELQIEEVGAGSAEITLTADDGRGGTVSDVAAVVVSAPPNNPPVISNPIEDIVLVGGFGTWSIDLSSVFSDVDGDVFVITTTSNDDDVVSVAMTDQVLTIQEVGTGSAEITVTANDGNGGIVSDVFEVIVNEPPNQVPVLGNILEDVSLRSGFGVQVLELSGTVTDPDGDALIFTAESSDPQVVTVSVDQTELTLTDVGEGASEVTVTADDGRGGSVSYSFTVQVNPPLNVADAQRSEIVITPNPVVDVFRLNLTASGNSHAFSMTSLEGKEYAITARPLAAGEFEFQMGELPAGIYLLQIYTKGVLSVRKIVKR